MHAGNFPPLGDCESLTMNLALEEWRHWLQGTVEPFLIYIRSATQLNPQQARWALFFQTFTFHLASRPGSKNTKADALSRQFASSALYPDPEPILPGCLPHCCSSLLASSSRDTSGPALRTHPKLPGSYGVGPLLPSLGTPWA